MKLQFPDPEQFNFKDCIIAGDECVLVTPKTMGVEWTEQNKYFRSSIWRKSDKKLISAGFRKFLNYGEKPEFEPIDNNSRFTAVVKKDGSCLIVSRYKGELIIRTRGTVDATKLENGHEIAFLILKYPTAFNNYYLNTENCTLLFEWTTPTNRIVLNETSEPTLWLIGMAMHYTNDDDGDGFYTYTSQSNLDYIAKSLEVERPETYKFDVSDIVSLKQQIEPLKDIEGVVIYDETGQILKKIKTLRYLQLHRVFTGVKTVDHLFDLFVEYGCTHRENFETLLATNYDWELVDSLKVLLDELYLKWKRIQTQLTWIKTFLSDPKFLDLSRKDKAIKISELFKENTGIVFSLLDDKPISPSKLWGMHNA